MKCQLLTLEVLIATCGADGARKVAAMNLPELPRVSYLVSWQNSAETEIPLSLSQRQDVRIIRLDGLGLSRNRNNCLDNALGDILLIADDDLEFYSEGLQAILTVFEANPELEYASFRFDSEASKPYPTIETSLATLPKDFYQVSFEIALRRNSRAGKLRFNESFGLGAEKFTAGEEEFFLKKAQINRINCRFFPITIGRHPGLSTGVRHRLADGTIRSRGVFTVIEYPFTAFLRIPLAAWRIGRARQAGFFKALRLLISGALSGIFSDIVKPYLKSPLQ